VPERYDEPVVIEAAGTPPKTIREHVGRVATGESRVSLAHMTSPPGWSEPGQRPEFDEFTLVLTGRLVVDFDGGRLEVGPGQAVRTVPGEWVRYSTPEGADYVSVCLPAFTPQTAHRDD
jgi:mannose-6-phosphate isomerase-like protein (cupin superfamily)